MKKLQAIKSLFLLLLIVSLSAHTITATTVDDAPVYLNGGNEGLFTDLYGSLSTASLTQPEGIHGRALFTFAISKEGDIEVETIRLLRKSSLPEEYINAIKEAIKQLGKFKPGRQYNQKEQQWKPLRVHYNIGVTLPIPSKYVTSK